MGVASLRIDGVRPRWFIGLKQLLFRRSIECLGGSAKPHIRLRIRFLGAHPLQNFLRAHVHTLHVDVGMRFLEALLEVLEQLFSMRRVNDQDLAIVRTARGD